MVAYVNVVYVAVYVVYIYIRTLINICQRSHELKAKRFKYLHITLRVVAYYPTMHIYMCVC